MSRNSLQNLIGYWSPLAGPSAYTLLDYGGRGLHGSILQAGDTIWQANQAGWALQTDGVTNNTADYVSLPDAAGFSGDYTLSWWLTVVGNNSYGVLYYRTTSGQALAPLIYVGSGASVLGGTILIFSSGASSITRGAGLVANQLSHVAITRSDGVVRIYQDGRQQGADATQAVTFTGTITNNWLLAQPSGGENTAMQLSSFGMWDRALTPEEIWREYEGGPARMLQLIRQRPRKSYFAPPSFRAHYATQRAQLIGGGLR
jgi:hypothetical protein